MKRYGRIEVGIEVRYGQVWEDRGGDSGVRYGQVWVDKVGREA